MVLDFYAMLEDVCDLLCLQTIPEIYVQYRPVIKVYTTGGDRAIVVITSVAYDALTETELAFVLGHEIGNVKNSHVIYSDVAAKIGAITTAIGDITLGIGSLLGAGLRTALLAWSRGSELTSDHAGLLAV